MSDFITNDKTRERNRLYQRKKNKATKMLVDIDEYERLKRYDVAIKRYAGDYYYERFEHISPSGDWFGDFMKRYGPNRDNVIQKAMDQGVRHIWNMGNKEKK